MDAIDKGAHAARVVEWRCGEAEQNLYPECHFADREVRPLGEFQAEPLAEHLEVFARPVGGDGIRVVEIEGLNWPRTKGGQRAFAVLARHLAGADERLQGGRKQPAGDQVQHCETAAGRELADEAAERVVDDRGGVDARAAGSVQRDEFVGCTELMEDAG